MLDIGVSSAVCSVCGHSLGAKDVCLPCLLRMGFDEAEESNAFGDFAIERREDGSLWELGRGAMGVTYRAADNVLNRTVALKVIKTPTAVHATTVRERFLREARAAAALRHPNIAAVFQFGALAEGDRCYCAMELIEGETLDALVRRDGPLPVDLMLKTAIEVTRALIAAAERGLVHRDLKPGNIMLTRNENAELQVKVIDFGLAKAANAAGEMELTHNGFVGTPAFASPEQFAHGAIDARTDIYALGVTMWFALTGRLPFAAATIDEIRERQADGALPNEQLKAHGVPQPLIDLLQSCLAFHAADRPTSARELMRDLESCRAQIGKTKRSRKIALAAVACAIIAIVVFVSPLGRQRNVPLTSPLENTVAIKPTENAEAYLLFLRGRKAETSDDFRPAFELYRQAFALDPTFALAHARFSICASDFAQAESDRRLFAEARTAAEEALRLSPNLADAHIALARCYLYVEHNYERALKEVTRAAELAPNSAEVQLTAAFVYKGQNKFRQRIEALRRAEAIDPANRRAHTVLVLTYRWVRDWPHAIEELDRRAIVSSEVGPGFFVSQWNRARDEFSLGGNIDVLKKATTEETDGGKASPARLDAERFETAMFERDYASAASYLAQIPSDTFALADFLPITPEPKAFHEALLAAANGSAPRFREQALLAAERALQAAETRTSAYSGARLLADLALIHALLGRKEEAVREATNAVDAIEGPPGSIEKNGMSAALALVYAHTGETEKALDLIEHLLTVPCDVQDGAIDNMTLNDLKWRWIWDPLRSNPRFQKLLAGPEPKTVY